MCPKIPFAVGFLLLSMSACDDAKEDTGSDGPESTDMTDTDSDEGPDEYADGGADGSGDDSDSDDDDSGESDTGSTGGDTGTDEGIEIEVGERWLGFILPDTEYGEVTWEKATEDGDQCRIEGLMSDLILLEEACADCDWGATFTVTGLAVTLDEGACDLSVLDWEGTEMTLGHGATLIFTEDEMEYFELHQNEDDGWKLLENGFSMITETEDTEMDMWVFGEEFGDDEDAPDDTGEADEEEDDIDLSSVGSTAWTASIFTDELSGTFTWETYPGDGYCVIEGDLISITMDDGCDDCDFGATFMISGLTETLDGGACDSDIMALEGVTMQAAHGSDTLYDILELHELWGYEDAEWHEMGDGWSTFDETTNEWRFGEIIEE